MAGNFIARFVLRCHEVAPDAPERRRGAIENGAALVDRVGERGDQILERPYAAVIACDDRALCALARLVVCGSGSCERIADARAIRLPKASGRALPRQSAAPFRRRVRRSISAATTSSRTSAVARCAARTRSRSTSGASS